MKEKLDITDIETAIAYFNKLITYVADRNEPNLCVAANFLKADFLKLYKYYLENGGEDGKPLH